MTGLLAQERSKIGKYAFKLKEASNKEEESRRLEEATRSSGEAARRREEELKLQVST